jgi:hypothetical protein
MYYNVEIEIYNENGRKMVFLSNDGSSGCKYPFETREELEEIIHYYIVNMLDEGEGGHEYRRERKLRDEDDFDDFDLTEDEEFDDNTLDPFDYQD